MGLLFGYMVGKDSESDYGGGGGGSILLLLFCYGIYKAIERRIVANYSDNMFEIVIALILVSILLFRYSYKIDNSLFSRLIIYLVLYVIDYVLCITLSIVFFNYIGFTPFSLLIESWNVLGWESLKLIGYILWAIFKLLDLVCKIGSVILIQNIVFSLLKSVTMKGEKTYIKKA